LAAKAGVEPPTSVATVSVVVNADATIAATVRDGCMGTHFVLGCSDGCADDEKIQIQYLTFAVTCLCVTNEIFYAFAFAPRICAIRPRREIVV
jgi:hypothetical protein